MKRTIPGPRLRELLDAADLTQAQVGRELRVDAGQVSRWCTGRAPLRGANAAAVVELLRRHGVAVEFPPPGHRVFLSTPMASLHDDSYETDRAEARMLYDRLAEIAPPVYWAGAGIGSAAEFEAPDLATARNLIALAEAEAFVYLQLRGLDRPTSCHIELGMAIAWQIPVTVFAASEDLLPYTLRRFEAISGRSGIGGHYRFYTSRGAADAVRLLTIHGPELLGVAPGPARSREAAR